MTLRWEKQLSGDSAWGYAGELIVAMVVKVKAGSHAGKWVWHLDGVGRVHGWKHRGYRKSQGAAQRAAYFAWSRWCDAAGLTQSKSGDR